ncbi:presenilin-1-like [Dermacentor variabilis]|uniref:presenilin-1-like n=1 Tax=Dermacentor variabilis TaxID=34621 RepID=UPI003F5B488F
MDPRRVLGLLGRLYEEILRQAINLVTAVSICMLTVSVLTRVLESSRNDDLRLGYVRYPDKDGEGRGDEEPVMLMSSFANAFSFLSVIMIVNCTMVLLYKGGHYRIIQAWLMGGSAILLFATGYYYGGRLLFYFNFSVDHLTWSFITWNVGMAGIAALYFDGPFLMQQGYLIYTSVLMALTIEESLPEWTSWTLLVLISIWDVFAVLCVVGPLRMLLETAKERNEPLFPALIFSTSSAWCYDLGERTASLTDVRAISSAVAVRTDNCPCEAEKFRSMLTSPAPVHAIQSVKEHSVDDTTPNSPSSAQAREEHTYSLPVSIVTSDSLAASTNRGYLPSSAEIQETSVVVRSVSKRKLAMCKASSATTGPSETGSTPGKKEHAGGSSYERTPARQDPREFRATFFSRNARNLRGTHGGDFPDAQRYQTTPPFIPAGNISPCSCRNRRDRPAYTTDAARRYAYQAPADGLPGDRGMKMGLGDFIFYSVLVGEASRRGSAVTVVACYVSIIVGIFLTLALLVVLQKPLPALPLSISLGMLAYFSSVSLTEPFLDAVGSLAL